MNKKYKLAVFIMRGEPFHFGHMYVIQEAIKVASDVLVLLGSSNTLPNPRNPWSFADREKMVKGPFTDKCVHVRPIGDHPYDDPEWDAEVFDHVRDFTNNDREIVLIGHKKDATSFYLKRFPQWDNIDVPGFYKDSGHVNLIDATDIRNVVFSDETHKQLNKVGSRNREAIHVVGKISHLIPDSTREFLVSVMSSVDRYEPMYREAAHDRQYAIDWPGDPHVTVDCVVIQANHVLIGKRKFTPGKGQWALPGGFMMKRERIEDAALRELQEETSIDVPLSVLRNRIKHVQHFADPYRSSRAHVITFAHLIDLNSEIDRKIQRGEKAPVGFTDVKAADDLEEVKWVRVDSLRKEDLFEDHFDVIMKMIQFM